MELSTQLTPSLPPAYEAVTVSPPPIYSPELAQGEERLQQTSQARGWQPSGSYIVKRGTVTVVLNNQVNGTSLPVYSRLAMINGIVLIDSQDTVVSVNAKLSGDFEFTTSDAKTSIRTVSCEATLWSRDSEASACPSNVHLHSMSFPSTYTYRGEEHPLPPSFAFAPSGYPPVSVKSTYSLLVTVTYTRRNLSFIPKAETVRVPLRYIPRARPGRPILHIPLFCGIKTSPEEWQQNISDIKRAPSSIQPPITINVLLPSAPIFGVCDKIPIHVQLSGSLQSLRCLLHGNRSTTTTAESSFEPPKVYLTRQVTIESTPHANTSQSIIIGEGKIMSVPPTLSQIAAADDAFDVLDAEGEVSINCNRTPMGGFVASGVLVRVRLLSLRPSSSSDPNPYRISSGSMYAHRQARDSRQRQLTSQYALLQTAIWTHLTGEIGHWDGKF
ncbi:hypothetical protein CYLTODRAFT_350882 [Cylindrobasidium torrendii FP15055 ss-10]|uniref:Arrestin-like N-terminal domain-containing protein n=1 Tax=Cylindrobasidium torrendii FP15055 ss-10 TaxID=1314674 RepID=A0A0D7BE05_9AGAR|nr:hypothetical protein CYLTODRAFT_350882 [Cylindrobasidium torrendii FP15055 ss-10]